MDEACHPETGCQPLPGAMPDSSPPPDTAVDSAADSGTDASVGFSVDTPPSGAMITSFSQTFTGTCDDAATLSVTPESDDLTIVAFECVVGVLTIEVELKAGNGMRTFTVDDGTVSVPHTFVLDRECPPGFIGITGDASYGTDDLCLAKYEMRAEAGGGALANGGNGDMVYDPAFVASSRWDGTPWVRLNRQNASDECMGMPPGAFTGTFRIPTNIEWQVVARNVERTASNWSGGAVGTGMIATGNSDNNERFLEASADDSDGYVNTNNTVGEPWGAGAEQRRTLTLSNGEVVWDLAGNGREWVSDDVSGTDLSPSLPGGFQEYSDTSRFPAMSINRDMFGPSDAGYDSDQGMGQWFGGNAGAVLRGGLFGIWGRPTVGIFALDLDRASTDTVNGAGHAFRCVYIFP